MKNRPVFDFLGNIISEGDEVVVAFPSGNKSALRIGTVLKIEGKEVPIYSRTNPNLKRIDYQLEIEWDLKRSGGFLPSKPITKIWEDQDRFLKLTK